MRMEEGKAEVVVQRLDSGTKNEAGDYKCTACSWEGKQVAYATAKYHVQRCHRGSFSLERVVPMKPQPRKRKSQEGLSSLIVARRDARYSYNHRKKVRSGR